MVYFVNMPQYMYSNTTICDQICQNVFAHNFSVTFSPTPDGYNNRLTVHVCAIAKSSTVCLYWGFFMTSTSAQMVYKWPHLTWTSRQLAGNHHTTGWWDWTWICYNLWYGVMSFGQIIFLNQNPTTLWLPTTSKPPSL